MTLRAIETAYAGCRFRSRTEARWAVFFDALGVKWEYEKEGFELPSGRYLPDFWLPEHRSWIEVKGTYPSEREYRLAAELRAAGENGVWIVIGPPGEHSVVLPMGPVVPVGSTAAEIQQAGEKARSARFEFGQTPTPPIAAPPAWATVPLHPVPKFVDAPEDLPGGTRVFHAKFGHGTVAEQRENRVRILFDKSADWKMVIRSFVGVTQLAEGF